MNVNIIKEELKKSHLDFVSYLKNLSKDEYEFSFNNKWNASQHLDHVIKSVAVLAKAFSYPKWLLKYKFGEANRPSRTKEDLINRYLEKLKTAKSTPSPFQPKETDFSIRKNTLNKLNSEVKKLLKKTNKYSEINLDLYILPHPLLGKLTLREMLLFTDYHVKHHLELVKTAVSNK